MSDPNRKQAIRAFEECQLACGECKSMCLEHDECDLITICDLCMTACTQKVISLRRPSFCDSKTCAKITALCKHLIQLCHKQCKERGHSRCVATCEKALQYC